MVNRYKLLQGYKIHFVPGWDCHGMPIEQKALEELKKDHTQMSAGEIRNTGKRFLTKRQSIFWVHHGLFVVFVQWSGP